MLNSLYTFTIQYTYDTRGNILSKTYSLNGETVDTITYGYTDTTWKDRLTSYNGVAITYDTIGNPTAWHDGSTMSWQRGRQLASYTKNGTTVSFAYNDDGIRTSKTINDVTTHYSVVDGTLHGMSDGTNTLQFVYGNGLSSVIFNGTEYWYVYNAQGDVVGLIDANGNYVVKYAHDSWGKIISQTDSELARLNPFRYRGYIYDEETGLYYVSSRYYDPTIGRWLNSDSTNAITGYETTYSHHYNMFAYSINNPISNSDPSGEMVAAISASSGLIAALGSSNIWNPIGWVSVGIIVVIGIIYVGSLIVEAVEPYTLSKTSKTSGKERATGKPSWVNKKMVDNNRSAEENARRILDDKYGKGNWNKGPGSEFNKIKKWLTRDLGLNSITENDDDIIIRNGDVYIFDPRGGLWKNGVYYSRFC